VEIVELANLMDAEVMEAVAPEAATV